MQKNQEIIIGIQTNVVNWYIMILDITRKKETYHLELA